MPVGHNSLRPGNAFWTMLDDRARTHLLSVGTARTFARGDVLIREHELSDHLLVIRSGCVKVVADSQVGYQTVLALRNPGDLLGELAAMDGKPRSASLIALTSTSVLLFTADTFGRAQRSHPSITQAAQHVVSARLREADRYRAAAGADASRVRLAALLLELAGHYGRQTASGQAEIGLPLSQDDLAGIVLTSRRTVTRILEQWRDREWVATGRNRLVILDFDALKQQVDEGAGR